MKRESLLLVKKGGGRVKIKATKVKGGELKAGDLFSTANQEYWDRIDKDISIGEKVYIRTNTPCRKDQEGEVINKIEVIR